MDIAAFDVVSMVAKGFTCTYTMIVHNINLAQMLHGDMRNLFHIHLMENILS